MEVAPKPRGRRWPRVPCLAVNNTDKELRIVKLFIMRMSNLKCEISLADILTEDWTDIGPWNHGIDGTSCLVCPEECIGTCCY